jgi:hypothetical protein
MSNKENSKWSRTKTREFYVHSDETITFKVISSLSGNAASTIANWSVSDGWVASRQAYWSKVRAASTEKAIDSISDCLAEKRTEIAIRHFCGYKEFGDFARLAIKTKTAQLNLAVQTGDKEEIERVLGRLDYTSLNILSLMYDRSCKGEAASVGLKFDIDHEALVKAAESSGYKLIETSYLEELKNSASLRS